MKTSHSLPEIRLILWLAKVKVWTSVHPEPLIQKPFDEGGLAQNEFFLNPRRENKAIAPAL